MKKIIKLVLTSVTLVVLSGCDKVIDTVFNEINQSIAIETYVDQSSSVKCVDGDTFWYGDEKIRLLAIDTPETVHPDKPEEPFGKEASDLTCNLIQEAQTIELYYDAGNEKDRYGRSLYWVYVDGELLQEILISEGYAEIKYVDEKTVDTELLKTLTDAEQTAKSEARGIWSLD